MQIDVPALKKTVREHGKPSNGRALWQLANTVIPYLGLWALMAVTHLNGAPIWVTLLLALPAAALLLRIFIFFHDCCHGSFFRSHGANRFVGTVTGLLTFTPFHEWRAYHILHHATSGDLDRRGVGDVWMMTVDEYLAASRGRRLAYRLYRHPLVMLGLGPVLTLLWVNRISGSRSGRRGKISVWFTNVAILVTLAVAHSTIGIGTFLLIQGPVFLLAGMAGVWLFYVQHQYEGVNWVRHEEWNATGAALEGSSYYRLPKVLGWITADIGLHHLHHIRPRVPNYRLRRCHDRIPAVREVAPLGIRQSLKSLGLRLWDPEQRKLVGFRAIRGRAASG